MTFPQLRVRTGYTFDEVYGRLPQVIDALTSLGTKFAACVDSNTWAHVRWEQACEKAGIIPGFGMEIHVLEGSRRPTSWILARDTKAFYTLTSEATRKGHVYPALLSNFKDDVVRFVGGAFESAMGDPSRFDYIDINPFSAWATHQALTLHKETGLPLVLTGYNTMPRPENLFSASGFGARLGVGVQHICDSVELFDSMPFLTPELYFQARDNAEKIAEELSGVKLQKAPMIRLEGSLSDLCREGKEKRLRLGQIKEWTLEYETRLNDELEIIQSKGFDSYFLCVADLVAYAKTHMLVGPGRGSSVGSLICYLIGITEVDPIPYGLIFERFLARDRADMPDIDLDFNDNKRYMVQRYAHEKYGEDNVAQVGNLSQYQPKSILTDVSKRFKFDIGLTNGVKSSLITHSQGDERYGHSLEDTFKETEEGKSFSLKYPHISSCMSAIELHPSHSSVHAAGLLICNEPISYYCTVNKDGVAQIDKVDAEYLNLLKIDALGLSTLGIIEDAGVMSNEAFYSLTPTDPEVFALLNKGQMSAIFQLSGGAAKSLARQVDIQNFSHIVAITSIARPGPLGASMDKMYVERVSGRKDVTYSFPELTPHLESTFGVLIYQEQIMSICRDIGGMDWKDVTSVRKLMAKSKGAEALEAYEEKFVAGVVRKGIDEGKSRELWHQMSTFGRYGFNKSHSVAYSIVTYWTAYMKCYHPLEFAAACLRNAKNDEETIAILREMAAEGVSYTAMDPDHSGYNWKVVEGRLLGGIMNAKGFGPAKSDSYIQAREAFKRNEISEKDWLKKRASLDKAEVKFSDLNEAHTLWGHFYVDPTLAKVFHEPILNISDIEEGEENVFIGKLTKKEFDDMNSAARLKKNGGNRINGPSEIADFYLMDDSTDASVRCRIRPAMMVDKRQLVMDAKKGDWFLIRGWRLKNIQMFIIKNIKKLEKEIGNKEA